MVNKSLMVAGMCLGVTTAAIAGPKAEVATETGGALTAISQGDLARLGANKRVALASCVVEYQTSAFVENDGSWINRNESRATNRLVNVPVDTLQAVADQSCARLREDLAAAGYEVVVDGDVKANTHFQQMLALSGVEPVIGMKTASGGALIFSDAGLPLYLPTGNEWGANYISPENTAAFEQAMPDAKAPPGAFKMSRTYDLPRLEVELAKALNAHVLKAWLVVGFGGATADSKRDWASGHTSVDWQGNQSFNQTVNFEGAGTALLSVREHQSRFAFRFADGQAKGYVARDMGAKVTPKDGDLVIKLAGPVLAGNEFFNIEEGKSNSKLGSLLGGSGASAGGGGSGLFGGLTGGRRKGQASFYFDTSITDADKYRDAAINAVGAANRGLIARMKTPL